MPTNLNALIRYKTIDHCLGNRTIKCSIDRLRRECSEAIGEARGVYKTISERTIRDDIRVMRSDILGFNAPIILENGYYVYSEKNYSIFQKYIVDVEMLTSVYNILLEHKNSINNYLVNKAVFLLANSLNIHPPKEILTEMLKETNSGMNNSDLAHEYYRNNPDKKEPTPKIDSDIRFSIAPSDVHFSPAVHDSKKMLSISKAEIDYASIKHANENGFPWQSILVLVNHLK